MATVIRRVKDRQPGVPYDRWPTIESHATPEQEEAIEELKKEHPAAEVVVHRFIEGVPGRDGGGHVFDVLLALDRRNAVWVSPKGAISPAEEPYPFCSGNPTTAHCISHGYCTRSYACNE